MPHPALFRVLLQERHWDDWAVFAPLFEETARNVGKELSSRKVELATLPRRTFDHWFCGDWFGTPQRHYRPVLERVLAVLVLRLSQRTAPVGSPAPDPWETFVDFRDAVERDFTRTRRLADYARALGYSPRTLPRATLAGAGVGAKEFIDRRVILEAERLLTHGDQPASRIAAQLSFTSATDFSTYFDQRTGQSPITFRATVLGRSAKNGPGDTPGTGRPGQ